ncbi:TetR family transcriptional regulator [Nonomuraea terrae]|uniref:TetR family transcriptional regulator n=1 Tax=Nonomuraea terrae TaxID=2530383 RepID=A0A4R4YM50_9ACTN|nr:TetR/AcrR family transcriptional regulator C-terminal domain-containing protein [Nonomuraea terrae]TDD46036.1 TetR family transcriptional regulator [Nonomuraea terrae]
MARPRSRPARVTPNRPRGQNAGLTRQAILQAALALADREGLKALSMRRIGRELGVEAMSLYQHVADKEALLDGLVEQLFTQAAPPLVKAASWQEGLRDYAYALLRTLLAHPRVIPLVVTRPAVTRQNLRIMETALETLRTAGFTLERALDMLYAVTGFVVGHVAMLAPAGRPAAGAQPMPEVDPDETPLLAAATRARHASGPEDRFDFALGAMLRGFAAL